MELPQFKFILGKPLKGWLKKQGGVMRGWQRRWFILQEKCLFCFNKEDDTRMAFTYLLSDYDLKDIPNSPDEPDKFAFELTSVKGNGTDSVVLCAANEDEKKEWMKALCYHIYADKGGAIFGLPLEETMKYAYRNGRTVPHIVEACVRHLTTYGMDAEGIFRLAGRTGLMKELRSQFEMGQIPCLESVDVHTVASLFKSYLRELPESLVLPTMYQRAMNCAMRYSEASSEAARSAEVQGLAEILQDLPDANYATLAYICRFLSKLAGNCSVTKMDAKNLGLVFGPNLIRHMDNSPELLMVTADLAQHLAYMLISHCDEVLPYSASKEIVKTVPESMVIRRKAEVAADDLLRLSQPVDSQDDSLMKPLPTALKDLEGLQFTTQISGQDDVFSNSLSPDTPTSPMLFISDHFKSTAEGGSECSYSDADFRPVAPRRNRTIKKRRPPSSPVSPESSRHLDCQDILKALADVSATYDDPSKPNTERPCVSERALKQNCSAAEDSQLKGEFSSTNGSKLKDNSMTVSLRSEESKISVEQLPYTKTEAFASYSDKLGKSSLVMETQIAGLKTELMNVKAKAESQVKALTKHMTEMKDRYEARISSMEKQHQRLLIDLRARLEAEAKARAEAVERTMALQAQLYKYKLQYGDMSA